MTFVENVLGHKDAAVPLIEGKTTVYIKNKIRKFTPSNGEDNPNMYVWDEYQYDKDEYILAMNSKLDYLAMMSGVDLNV